MTLYFSLYSWCYLVLSSGFVHVVSGSANSSNSSCIQAAAKPTVKAPCVPLQYNTYCRKKGIILDQFVFVSNNTQLENDKKLNKFQKNLPVVIRFLIPNFSGTCAKAIDIVYCHHYFPSCDNTADSYKVQTLCRETCQYFTNACSHELKRLSTSGVSGSSLLNIIDCAKFPWRNAGESPECYYFDVGSDGKGSNSSKGFENDCTYQDGRSYQGNTSVTSSGIPCQPWTAQCPHRHTMVSTYPELKNASNYCRNPRGSGQRPWCFTSDMNNRWEYCDIPRCLSAMNTISVTPTPTITTIKTVLLINTTATIAGKIGLSSLSRTMITASKTVIPTATTKLPTKLTPTVNTTKSVCSPAEPLPSVHYPCTPLNGSYGAYCKKQGVKLDSHVFKDINEQKEGSDAMRRFQVAVDTIIPFYKTIQVSKECLRLATTVYCRYYFPSCDQTGRQMWEHKLCKATCDFFKETCSEELKAAKRLNDEIAIINNWPYVWNILNCTRFPTRDAGTSPECWYYEGKINETRDSRNSSEETDDCLYLAGRSYQGNISVTSSGLPCQPWTAQCPHRHTMVSTYPEIKNASNYCRNPRGSGQRPWCFTSNMNNRWEYCDIPRCLPVNGSYGNWTLSRRCNSNCGQGNEEWRRLCDNPAPKYDGNNCSSLGSAREYRNCSNLPPCPINGKYGRWLKNSTCNVTCGDGFEMWIRKCDNPTPAYGGLNCLVLGEAEKWETCRMIPCGNPPTGKSTLRIAIGAGVGPVVLVFIVILAILGYRKIKRQYEPYATLHFDKAISMKPIKKPEDSTKPDVASIPRQTYANLTENGEPLPGVCRGIIPYQQPYVNETLLKRPHYSKLQLFSSITLDWLRNAWGQVDELGTHVYDALFRGMELSSPYDKPKVISRKDCGRDNFGAIDENGDAVYDKFVGRRVVLMLKERVHSSEETDETKDKDKSINEENLVV